MNTKRELFLLFQFVQEIEGYTVIHKHTFPNDEPPYIMVSYWGIGKYNQPIYEEDCEFVQHYLIRTKDAERFIALMNHSQTSYCEYYIEGVYTRNAGEHNLKPADYAKGGYTRPPKIKYLTTTPMI